MNATPELKPICFGSHTTCDADCYTCKYRYMCMNSTTDARDRKEEAMTKPTPDETNLTPLDRQVGGSHYKDLKIQPVEYIHANNIGYMEGNVIKYVSRWRAKNGIKDLEKAKHYIELLIQLETQRGEDA